MLDRVRDGDRFDRHDPSFWPEAPDAYGRGDPVRSAAGLPDRSRRTVRRSAAGRVVLTLMTAIAVVSTAMAVYFSERSGALDGVLGRIPGSATSSVVDNRATPSPAETAQSVPRDPPQAVQAPPLDVAGLVILIRNTIVALHQANTTGNYSVLRDIAAPGFQQANSPASLGDAFSDLRGRGIDLGQVLSVNPLLNIDPVIDDQGFLRIVGFFPAGSEQVDFDLAFQAVDGRWRLFGLSVQPAGGDGNLDDSEARVPVGQEATAATAIPETAALLALIRGSLLALNQASMTGNYSVLLEMSAPGFRAANDLPGLAAAFADLRASRIDLGPVAVIDPSLFRPPAIDENGYLRLTGVFPSKPEQVNFDLAFQFAGSAWKLFGIGVNTSREAPAGPTEAAANDAPAAGESSAADSDGTVPPTPALRPQSRQ